MRRLVFCTTLFLLAAVFLHARGEEPYNEKYPYLSLTPERPVAGESEVVLYLYLGEAGNSCMAPGYTDVEAVVTQSPLTVHPPQFNVELRYTEVQEPDKACPMIYAPVDYGPQFRLGVLREGQYVVVDRRAGGEVVGRFSVGPAAVQGPVSILGVVTDDPYPTRRMGTPLGGAKLYLLGDYEHDRPLTREPSTGDETLLWQPLVRIIDSTVSGRDGTFGFSASPGARYTIQALLPDYYSGSVTLYLQRDTSVALALLSTDARAVVEGSVTERVSGSGEAAPVALAGCTVLVFSAGGVVYRETVAESDGAVTHTSPAQYRAVTDRNGNYRIEGIRITENGGEWVVSARLDGYQSHTRTVLLHNMQTATVSFELEKLFANSSSATVDRVTYAVATQQSRIGPHDPLRVRYSVTNHRDRAVTFSPFSGMCEYEMVVATVEGSERYRLSADRTKPCNRMLTSVTVDPGQTLHHAFDAWYHDDNRNVAEADVLPADEFLLVTAGFRGERFGETLVSVRVQTGPSFEAVAARSGPKASVYAKTAVRSMGEGAVSVTLERAQVVRIVQFGLDGKVVSSGAGEMLLPAGTTRISLTGARASGIGIVQISGDDFSTIVRLGRVSGVR